MEKHIKTKGQAQLFQNPILEFFTKSSALESSITSISIAIICFWLGLKISPETPLMIGIYTFLVGIISWSLFEYLLHRYLFHIAEDAFKGSKRLQYLLHGVHHEYPNDAQRTLMPFLPKLIFAVIFFVIFFILLGRYGAFFSGGFMMGYYFYSMMHYSIHRFKPPSWLKPLWEHHHLHHHLHQDKAFGVSSRLWDWIFHTMPPQYKNKSKETHVSPS